MPRYKVELNWEWEGEAEDEGDAFQRAELNFFFYREANANNLDDDREKFHESN